MGNPTSINIDQLLIRNPGEIRKLVNQFSDMIFNVAYSYIGNKEDAEEITQDVFIACLDSLHFFKRQSSLSTWLYRIVINKSKDKIKYYQSKKRKTWLISLEGQREEFSKIEPVEFRHPGIELEEQEQLNALYNAIHSLPERQKEVLILS